MRDIVEVGGLFMSRGLPLTTELLFRRRFWYQSDAWRRNYRLELGFAESYVRRLGTEREI